MTKRTFRTEPPEPRPDRIEVEITGTYGPNHPKAGEDWSETFTMIDEMPVGALALWQRTAGQAGTTTVYHPGPVVTFLTSLMDPHAGNSHLRFYSLCDDPDRIVRLDLLVDIMHWAVEELTGRPTGPATTSSGGEPGTETS